MSMIDQDGAWERDSQSSPPKDQQSWWDQLGKFVLTPAIYIEDMLLEMRGVYWRNHLDELVDDTGKTGRQLLIDEFGGFEGGRRLLEKWNVEVPSVRGEAQE